MEDLEAILYKILLHTIDGFMGYILKYTIPYLMIQISILLISTSIMDNYRAVLRLFRPVNSETRIKNLIKLLVLGIQLRIIILGKSFHLQKFAFLHPYFFQFCWESSPVTVHHACCFVAHQRSRFRPRMGLITHLRERVSVYNKCWSHLFTCSIND